MVWTEIDVARQVGNGELRRAVAGVFGIADSRVRVVADFAREIAALDPNISAVVEQHAQPGNFPQRLMIVLWDGTLASRVGAATSMASFAAYATLAATLNSSLIVPDTGLDPSVALLFEPSGEVFRVSLDEDAIERQGGVVIAADPPMVAMPDLSFRPGRPALTS